MTFYTNPMNSETPHDQYFLPPPDKKHNFGGMGYITGRPAIFSSPELMAQAIDLYLATCEAEKKQPSITRMALALGFESRQSFYDYEGKPEFSYVIKTARLYVEAAYEDGLRENNCTGSIFALKNMGWKDKVENEVYGKDGGPMIQIIMPKGE